MALLYEDNAKSSLLAPILIGDTSLTLQFGDGAMWPVIPVGGWTYTTIIEASDPTNLEVVRVTARVGDVLTIVRGIGGVQQPWNALDRVELRVCKAMLDDIAITPSGLLQPTPVIIVAGYTAVAGDLVYCDTTGGAFDVTLPITPSNGDRVGFVDVAVGGFFETNNLTINQNGELIDGVNDTFVLDADKLYIVFLYDAAGGNWILSENPVGGTGGGGGGGVSGVPTRIGAEDIDGAVNLIDTNISLYTVPAATYPSEVVIKICNRNVAMATVRLAHINGAIGAIALEDYLLYDVALLPYETKVFEIDGMVATDTLLVRSDIVDVSFVASAKLPIADANLSRIAATVVVADTNTTLLTTAGAAYEDCSLIVCNKDVVNPATIRVALINGAIGVLAAEDYIIYEDVILQGETKVYSDFIHVPDVHTVMVRASDADVSFVLYGKLFVA